MRRPSIALAAVAVVLSAGSGARAERAGAERLLERAVEAWEDLRIEDSLDLLDQAERAGGLDESAEARLFLYRGLGRASLGESEEAGRAFRRAVELDAEIELPDALSPVVRRQFDEIRSEVLGSVEPDVPPPDDGGGTDDGTSEGGGTEPPPPPPPQLPPPPHRLLLTWVGLGLTGALFVAGATSTILAEATRAGVSSEERAQRHVDDLVDAYRLEARLGVALLGTAVAMGLTTLLVWLGERDVPGETQTPAVTVGPSGLSVSGTVRF